MLQESPIELADSEYAHVVAVVLTYLYALDYNQSGQLLPWGVPQSEEGGLPVEDNQEPEDVDDHSEGASSREDYNLIEEACSTSDSQQGLTTVKRQKQPSVETRVVEQCVVEFSQPKDTSLQPSPLVFHAQIYCAAIKLGVSCLAKVAKHRCMHRLQSRRIG